MRLLFLSFVTTFVLGGVNAQSLHNVSKQSRGSGGDLSTLMHLQTVVQTKGILATNDESIDGTLYLFQKWEGKNLIYVSDKKAYSLETLNYNLVSKTIETKISKDSVYQFNNKQIFSIKRDNKNYKYFTVNNIEELYQVIFSSEKVTFIKGFILDFTKAKMSPMTQETLSRAKYTVKDKFFYKINDTDFVEIKPKKKTILDLFKEKSTQVEKYVNDNNLSYLNENDLYKIFQFYDSL